MEENNTFINEETVQNETEQKDIHQDEPAVEISFEPKPAPKKKTGGFKKLLTGLLSMVLIPSAVGFGSGIAAYKLMDNANDKVILQTIQSQTIPTTSTESTKTNVAEEAPVAEEKDFE